MSTLLLVSVLHLVAICLLIGASRSNRLQLAALKQRADVYEKRLALIEPAQLAELDRAVTARLVAVDDATDVDDGLRRLAAVSEARVSALAPRATAAEDLLRTFGFPAWPESHQRSAIARRYDRYRMSVYGSDSRYAWTVTIEMPPPHTLTEEERSGWIHGGSLEEIKARAATEMIRLLADHGISVVPEQR